MGEVKGEVEQRSTTARDAVTRDADGSHIPEIQKNCYVCVDRMLRVVSKKTACKPSRIQTFCPHHWSALARTRDLITPITSKMPKRQNETPH